METRTWDNRYGLKLGEDNDFYKSTILLDCKSGKRATFTPKLVNGTGWTVLLRIGSNKTGYAECDIGVEKHYTMHQAAAIAETLRQDAIRFLKNENSRNT